MNNEHDNLPTNDSDRHYDLLALIDCYRRTLKPKTTDPTTLLLESPGAYCLLTADTLLKKILQQIKPENHLSFLQHNVGDITNPLVMQVVTRKILQLSFNE